MEWVSMAVPLAIEKWLKIKKHIRNTDRNIGAWVAKAIVAMYNLEVEESARIADEHEDNAI